GWDVMVETAGPGFLDMWQPVSHPDFPWTGILFGAPILGVWYWCTDQFIVQRVLSARNESEARRGTIFAGFLKLLPVFIFVIPGVIAYVLVQQGKLELAQPDQALPTLVGALLPAGLRGIVVAGLLAALMSSLSSVFNSCSTLITWDVYKEFRPQASDRHLVWVGQISTVFLVVLALLWIPLMGAISEQIYTYLQSVQAYISPPIAAVFLLGILWRRVNARGAMAALLTGFVLGMGRLVAELNQDALEGWLHTFATINFLHFAIALFVVCTVVLVGVSLTAPAPPREKLRDLTFGELSPAPAEASERERRVNVILSVLLLLAVGAVWVYFSG
ncbi:MAG: sodium:solute symporter family transporter, partial [Vicinamibacteria bacterium]